MRYKEVLEKYGITQIELAERLGINRVSVSRLLSEKTKFIIMATFAIILLGSCGNGRTKEEQKAYTDSLFHVISCSPTIVGGPYTLENQLNACDLLIEEYPDRKSEIEKIKKTIQLQIREQNNTIIDFED